MASGGRPRRRMTENDRELAAGALTLALVALVVVVAWYWMTGTEPLGPGR
jgi:hypothetical protein